MSWLSRTTRKWRYVKLSIRIRKWRRGTTGQYNPLENYAGWYLEELSDKFEGLRRLYLTPLPFRIGRQSSLSLCLNSREISREHAEIFEKKSSLYIRDLGSTNGTFLNYERLTAPAKLNEGDIIHFGKLEFRINREMIDYASLSEETAEFYGDLPRKLPSGTKELQTLINEKAVTSYFQPLIDLSDGQIFGYEVLGRGNLPGFESDPQNLFRIASSVSLSADLSELFRQTGIAIGATLPGRPVLFINTHPAEMLDWSKLITNFQSLRSGFPLLPFTIEIHERAITDIDRMRSLRSLFQELHIGLAYDDFGAGQARLLELVEVPPDYLKIDRSLIKNIHLAPQKRQRMIEMLVVFLRESEIKTIAEGISCAEEEQICKQLKFDYAQGFYYGEPVPKDNICSLTGF